MKRSNNNHIFFNLREYENAAIVTFDGKYQGSLFQNPTHQIAYADVLQEMMSDIMHNETARDGLWIWKISENWKTIAGWELTDEFYDM